MSPDTLPIGLAAQFGLSRNDLLPVARQARQKLNSGQPKEALSLFGQLVLGCPDDRDFQIGLAHAALASDEPELALQAATAAIVFEPTRADGYLLSGRACLALEDFGAAEEDFAEAVTRAASTTPEGDSQAAIGQVAQSCLDALKTALMAHG